MVRRHQSTIPNYPNLEKISRGTLAFKYYNKFFPIYLPIYENIYGKNNQLKNQTEKQAFLFFIRKINLQLIQIYFHFYYDFHFKEIHKGSK
jgi:hypothetical protein